MGDYASASPEHRAFADRMRAEIRAKAWEVVTFGGLVHGVDIGRYREAIDLGIEAGMTETMRFMLDEGVVPRA